MMNEYSVGAILQNSIGHFSKIISIRLNTYGISQWSATRKMAEDSKVASLRINKYGIKSASIKVVSKSEVEDEDAPSDSTSPSKSSLSKMSVDNLKKLAEELGLSVTGTKPVILAEVLKFYKL